MKMMTMMTTTNFSEIKKQGRNKGFKIGGGGGGRKEIKVFGQNIYQYFNKNGLIVCSLISILILS